MMASQSSQLVGHQFCFSTPSVWRFRLNRLLAGPSAAIFNFTCFSSTGCENIQNTNKLLTAIDQSQLIPPLLLLHSDLIETNDPVENLRDTRDRSSLARLWMKSWRVWKQPPWFTPRWTFSLFSQQVWLWKIKRLGQEQHGLKRAGDARAEISQGGQKSKIGAFGLLHRRDRRRVNHSTSLRFVSD